MQTARVGSERSSLLQTLQLRLEISRRLAYVHAALRGGPLPLSLLDAFQRHGYAKIKTRRGCRPEAAARASAGFSQGFKLGLQCTLDMGVGGQTDRKTTIEAVDD